MGCYHVQERIDDSNGYDDPAHPDMHRCEIGWLLCLLVDPVVHEAKHKLANDENKEQDTEDLVGIVELLGLPSVSIAQVLGVSSAALPCCRTRWYGHPIQIRR